jgi:hypothetical protein
LHLAAGYGGLYNPRLLFDRLCPRKLCAVVPALPPPRSRFVALGFLPELRRVPGRFPGRAPALVRAPRVPGRGVTSSDFSLCDMVQDLSLSEVEWIDK